MMADPVTFYAAVAKVQTLADGGIRIWLDLPEDAIVAAAELMAFKRAGVVLDFVGTEKTVGEPGAGKRKEIHI